MLCYSENTSLEYNTSHQGLYEHVCGVKPNWNDYLDALGVKRNSLKAGIEVYKFYFEKYQDKRVALLKFKGADKNKKVKKIVNKIIKLEREYKDRFDNLKSLK